MTPATRLSKIQHLIDRMPSLSTTVTKVLEICSGPSPSANDLNRVISYDPVLTGQMLKLINSAYYGLPNRITTLTRAIIMLGINTVKNMVLTTSIMAGCKGLLNSSPIHIDEFWLHCLCVGVLSKLMAITQKSSSIEREEFFVAGLLHDLGKLPMLACFPDLYRRVIKNAREQAVPLIESEADVIGFNHCQVGHLIVAKWKLGVTMQHVIGMHHHLDENADRIVKQVAVANHLANWFQVGSAGESFVNPLFLEGHALFEGLSLHGLDGLKTKMEAEIERAKVFLQLEEEGDKS